MYAIHFFDFNLCIVFLLTDTTPPRKILDKPNATLFEASDPDVSVQSNFSLSVVYTKSLESLVWGDVGTPLYECAVPNGTVFLTLSHCGLRYTEKMVAVHFTTVTISCEPNTANRRIEIHIFDEIRPFTYNIVYVRFELFRTFLCALGISYQC